MPSNRMINLAVFLPQDKAKKIRIPERIEMLCQQEGIKITTIDKIEQLTDKNNGFDVLIHKVHDFYNEDECDEQFASEMVKQVKCLAENNPDMVSIDDVESCLKFYDRKHCHDLMQACSMEDCGIDVFVPKSIEIRERMPKKSVQNLVISSDIKFPVLTKPLHAQNKIMSLVFNMEGFDDVIEPCMIQEFSNHNGVMYKVFVIGDRYSIIQRPSIKNYEPNETQKSIAIDSRNVSKMGRGYHPEIHDNDPALQSWSSDLQCPEILNRKVLDKLCSKMSKLSNLYLFGFDVLVVKKTGDYALVDINQFPGYKGIPDDVFAENIVNLVKQCHNNKDD